MKNKTYQVRLLSRFDSRNFEFEGDFGNAFKLATKELNKLNNSTLCKANGYYIQTIQEK